MAANVTIDADSAPNGEIVQEGGYTLLRKKNRDKVLSNFVFVLYGHCDDGDGRTYAYKCTQIGVDGLANNFFVTFRKIELCQFGDVYDKFIRSMPRDCFINKEASSKADLNVYLADKCALYDGRDHEYQRKVIILRNIGHCSLVDIGDVYVIGRTQIVPAGLRVDSSLLKERSKFIVWEARKEPDCNEIDTNSSLNTFEEFEDLIEAYHKGNSPAFSALIGHVLMGIHRQFLNKSMKLGLAHIIGDNCTGKSTMADQLVQIFPGVKNSSTGMMYHQMEFSMTKHILMAELVMPRPPIIADPPPEEKSEMHEIADNHFNNCIKKSRTTCDSNSSTFAKTSAIFVHPGESSELGGKFNTSVCTKGLFLNFERSEDFEKSKADEIMEKIRRQDGKYTSIFYQLVQRFEVEELVRLQKKAYDKICAHLEELFGKKGARQLVTRMIENYSNALGAYTLFVTKIGMTEAKIDTRVQKLVEYFCKKCIPKVARSLSIHLSEAIPCVINASQDIVTAICQAISQSPSPRKLLSWVSFSSDGLALSKAVVENISKKNLDRFYLAFGVIDPKRYYFFDAEDPEHDYFRRNTKRMVYGTARKLLGYLILTPRIPNSVKVALAQKLNEISPSLELNEESDFRGIIQHYYDTMYLSQEESQCNQMMDRLAACFSKLTLERQRKVITVCQLELDSQEDGIETAYDQVVIKEEVASCANESEGFLSCEEAPPAKKQLLS